jgi:hypothetical protein
LKSSVTNGYTNTLDRFFQKWLQNVARDSPHDPAARLHVVQRGLYRQQLQAENIRMREALTIYQVIEALATSLDLDHILDTIPGAAVKETGADVPLPARRQVGAVRGAPESGRRRQRGAARADAAVRPAHRASIAARPCGTAKRPVLPARWAPTARTGVVPVGAGADRRLRPGRGQCPASPAARSSTRVTARC